MKSPTRLFSLLQVYGATYLQKLLEPLLRAVITSNEWQHVSFEVDPTRFESGWVGRKQRGEEEVCNILLTFPITHCSPATLDWQAPLLEALILTLSRECRVQ